MVNDQNDRKLDCKYCGKVFKSHHYVKTHEKWHEGELKHKCNYCGRNFRFPSELKKHNSIHTGEDPYKCETCGKGFGWAQTLNEHIRVDHGARKDSVQETPATVVACVCVQCNKRFENVQLLNDHIKQEHTISTIQSTNPVNVKQEAYEDSWSFPSSSVDESSPKVPNNESPIVSNNNEASKSKATIKQESFEDYSSVMDPFSIPFQPSFPTPDIAQNILNEADQQNDSGINNNKSIMDEALSLSGIFDPWQAEPSLTLFESFNPEFESLIQPNPEYAPLLPMPAPFGAAPFHPSQMEFNQEFAQFNPALQIPNRQAQSVMQKKEEKNKRMRRHAEVVSEDWRPDESLPEGWMIRVHTRQNTRVSGSYQRDVYYKAPCGQKIGSREAVVEYIRKQGASEEEVARVRNGYKNYKRKPLANNVKTANATNAATDTINAQTNGYFEERADCAKCKKIKEIETILQELRNHLC